VCASLREGVALDGRLRLPRSVCQQFERESRKTVSDSALTISPPICTGDAFIVIPFYEDSGMEICNIRIA